MVKSTRARGIERAIEILDHLHSAGKPMVINELAEAMDAPRSTVYDLVRLLIKRSILDTYGDENRVYLGRKLLSYGRAVEKEYSLLDIARPHIDALSEECGEIAEICSNVDWKQCVLYAAQSKRPYFSGARPGELYPLPSTATGRFFIHGHDRDTLAREIPEADYFYRGRRLATLDSFLRESEIAADQGFCIVSGLTDPYLGVIAVPIHGAAGDIIAAISIFFPVGELEKKRETFLNHLFRAKQRIEKDLAPPR